MTVTCNDPGHEARRRAAMRDEYLRLGIDLTDLHAAMYGEPCLICGAPINSNGEGHDDGCMGLDS